MPNLNLDDLPEVMVEHASDEEFEQDINTLGKHQKQSNYYPGTSRKMKYDAKQVSINLGGKKNTRQKSASRPAFETNKPNPQTRN